MNILAAFDNLLRETWNELNAVCLFHMAGFALDAYKVSASIQSWSYPDVARYPNQLGAWSMVHISKWSSWSLLVIMTFTIVASLKHIKSKIHIAEA